jgi:1,2-diacylglycerol 3-alpha-glucosyltransferase
MRILLFSDTYPPEINGVSVSVQNHAKVLKLHGHEVKVITTSKHLKFVEEDGYILRIPGIELKKLYGYRMSSFFSASAFQYIKKWKPQIVHIHTDAGIGIFGKIVSSVLKIPSVVTYHTMYEDYTHYAGFLKGFANRVVKRFSKSIAEQCTEFIAPSLKTKDKIREYGADRYINIVPTGIDFQRFQHQDVTQDKIEEIKTKHNLNGKRILLSLGRVAKEKSIDVVIEGFSHYLKTTKDKNTILLIVGDGPEKNPLMAYVNELKIESHVVFVGAAPITEVPLYYQLADVFTSASITETQGLTFMEAMVSQRPVLCRFDENLSTLIEHGKTGFIFSQKEDFSILLQQMLTLNKEAKTILNQQALEAVHQYSFDVFYKNLEQVYHRAIRQYW